MAVSSYTSTSAHLRSSPHHQPMCSPDLAALIEDAIVPMNNKGVCHADLKSENIMLGADGHMRIIDWGLGGVLKNLGKGAVGAKFLEHRPFQFNVPFTLPLLGNFKTFYNAGSTY